MSIEIIGLRFTHRKSINPSLYGPFFNYFGGGILRYYLHTTVRDMPQPCDQLLKLVIYMKKSNKEVAEIMNYANADSVKTQRSRCMKKLGDKVKQRFKAAGYEQ